MIDLSLPFKLCFEKKESNIVPVNIASDKTSVVFIALRDGKVTKINLQSNSVDWISDLGGEIISGLIFDNGIIYLVTQLAPESDKISGVDDKKIVNYILWSLDARTGLTVWQIPFSSHNTAFLAGYQDKVLVITKEGIVNSIKKNSGLSIFGKNLSLSINSAAFFSENKIYIPVADNSVVTVSADSEKIISRLSKLQSPSTALVAAGDELFIGEKKGLVSLFNIKTNRRVWSVRFGGEISNLALIPGGVLVFSLDNFVYLISRQKGRTIWKRRLAGRISGNPLIVENFAVVVTASDENAVVLDLKNGRVVNRISLADIGFVLSSPSVVENSLVFSTNRGIFAFTEAKAKCFQK